MKDVVTYMEGSPGLRIERGLRNASVDAEPQTRPLDQQIDLYHEEYEDAQTEWLEPLAPELFDLTGLETT